MAPPEEISDGQKLRGLASTQMEWARPNDVPFELHMVRGLVRVRIRRCAMCDLDPIEVA